MPHRDPPLFQRDTLVLICQGSVPVLRTLFLSILVELCVLHSNALRQVSGLVYVADPADGYVIGELVGGNYFEDGKEDFGRLSVDMVDMKRCGVGDGGEWGIRTPDRAFAL
jgi:hypothetical protein